MRFVCTRIRVPATRLEMCGMRLAPRLRRLSRPVSTSKTQIQENRAFNSIVNCRYQAWHTSMHSCTSFRKTTEMNVRDMYAKKGSLRSIRSLRRIPKAKNHVKDRQHTAQTIKSKQEQVLPHFYLTLTEGPTNQVFGT